jgi:hypothetical protein
MPRDEISSPAAKCQDAREHFLRQVGIKPERCPDDNRRGGEKAHQAYRQNGC